MTETSGESAADGACGVSARFLRWDGPWHITTLTSIDSDGHREEWTGWIRDYRERSLCDTAGCCEDTNWFVGPQVSMAGEAPNG